MLKVIETIIKMTRGDTVRIPITIKKVNGENYFLQEGDVLEMTVRKCPDMQSDVLIHKVIPNVDPALTLKSQDTSGLAYGDYVYDIQLTLSNGDVNTIIPISKLVICEEVTM